MSDVRPPAPPDAADAAPAVQDPAAAVSGTRPLPATDASGAGIADPGAGAAEGAHHEPTLAQSAASAAAAMFGVQSSKNRERDFKARSPERFIIMGAVMTCLFVLVVLLAVRCAMLNAGYGQPESPRAAPGAAQR